LKSSPPFSQEVRRTKFAGITASQPRCRYSATIAITRSTAWLRIQLQRRLPAATSTAMVDSISLPSSVGLPPEIEVPWPHARDAPNLCVQHRNGTMAANRPSRANLSPRSALGVGLRFSLVAGGDGRLPSRSARTASEGRIRFSPARSDGHTN
jgi:hypothetical protein